jgi:hypothetical protein
LEWILFRSIEAATVVVGPLTDPNPTRWRRRRRVPPCAPVPAGFGFSGQPSELGYNRYVARGGDIGANAARVSDPIFENIDLENTRVRVGLVDDDIACAFSEPGGRVAIDIVPKVVPNIAWQFIPGLSRLVSREEVQPNMYRQVASQQ